MPLDEIDMYDDCEDYHDRVVEGMKKHNLKVGNNPEESRFCVDCESREDECMCANGGNFAT